MDWQFAVDAPSAEAVALAIGDHGAVMAALMALPPRQREVLVLRYWLECTEREIAAMLGISAGTVKSSASRGLHAMQRALGATDA